MILRSTGFIFLCSFLLCASATCRQMTTPKSGPCKIESQRTQCVAFEPGEKGLDYVSAKSIFDSPVSSASFVAASNQQVWDTTSIVRLAKSQHPRGNCSTVQVPAGQDLAGAGIFIQTHADKTQSLFLFFTDGSWLVRALNPQPAPDDNSKVLWLEAKSLESPDEIAKNLHLGLDYYVAFVSESSELKHYTVQGFYPQKFSPPLPGSGVGQIPIVTTCDEERPDYRDWGVPPALQKTRKSENGQKPNNGVKPTTQDSRQPTSGDGHEPVH